MERVLIINNNESIITLLMEYAKEYKETIKIVNEKPPVPITTVSEAIKKIKETEFDVLVIGHKLSGFKPELIYAGMEKDGDGEGLKILNNAGIKNILASKMIISDGQTPYSNNEVRNLYINAGVRHFINRRPVSLTDRFINLMLYLGSKCDCDSL